MTRDFPLCDAEGENQAVRCFLLQYQGNPRCTTELMRQHLTWCGYEGCWPQWVEKRESEGHLTKSGAQNWLRYLFWLETQP